MFPRDDTQLFGIWWWRYYATLYFLMLVAGIRSCESRAVRWKDVDWRHRVVRIEKAVRRDCSITQLKQYKCRFVIIPSRAAGMLSDWKDRSDLAGGDDYIFHGLRGNPIMRAAAVANSFKNGLIRARINPGGRNAVSLRYTYYKRMKDLLPSQIVDYLIAFCNQGGYRKVGDPIIQASDLMPYQGLVDSAWN